MPPSVLSGSNKRAFCSRMFIKGYVSVELLGKCFLARVQGGICVRNRQEKNSFKVLDFFNMIIMITTTTTTTISVVIIINIIKVMHKKQWLEVVGVFVDTKLDKSG